MSAGWTVVIAIAGFGAGLVWLFFRGPRETGDVDVVQETDNAIMDSPPVRVHLDSSDDADD